MFVRFYNLCSKITDTSVVNFTKRCRHAKTNVRHKQLDINTNEDVKVQKGRTPIISCKRSSYNFYKGDAYKKHGKIPLASTGWNHRDSRGDHFFIHPIDQKINPDECNEEIDVDNFEEFALNPSIYKTLESMGIKQPLEIQRLGIPKIMVGRSTLLAGETGCGKTLAYVLPMLHQVLNWREMVQRKYNSPFGLIVTPTRELAVQIGIELLKLCRKLKISVKIITGGKTKRMMRNPPVGMVDIVVASFGVISKLTTMQVYKLDYVKYLVLDEVDALSHRTFEDKVNVFLKRIPITHIQDPSEDFPQSAQLVLASATVPKSMPFLNNIIDINMLVHVTTGKLHSILVPQKFMRVGPSQKPVELLKFMRKRIANKDAVIIFSNQNTTSHWITEFLKSCDINCINLNGSMPLVIRQGKYKDFINGKALVLSATNAVSRGLDTVMVNHILNYDFPLDTADYIHRCGRTGRIGSVGHCRVTNFITKRIEVALVQKIERAVRTSKPMPIINMANQWEIDEEPYSTNESLVTYEDKLYENMEDAESIPY